MYDFVIMYVCVCVIARASAQASLRFHPTIFPFLLTVLFLVVTPAREEAMRSVAGHIDESEVESLMLVSMLLLPTLVLLLFITMLLLLPFVVVVVAAGLTVDAKIT